MLHGVASSDLPIRPTIPSLTIVSGKMRPPRTFLELGESAKKMFHQLVTFGKNQRAFPCGLFVITRLTQRGDARSRHYKRHGPICVSARS
jgi:hypothetical protein